MFKKKGILCSLTDVNKGDFNSNKNIKSISFESEEITELPDSFLLNDGLMSIFWTQKVKLFYAVLLANNSHCSGVI